MEQKTKDILMRRMIKWFLNLFRRKKVVKKQSLEIALLKAYGKEKVYGEKWRNSRKYS